MKNILITGGAGYIGSHVVEAFLNKNFIVNYKQDESPVSNIDIELGIFITNALKQNFPQIKVICEENDDSSSDLPSINKIFISLTTKNNRTFMLSCLSIENDDYESDEIKVTLKISESDLNSYRSHGKFCYSCELANK